MARVVPRTMHRMVIGLLLTAVVGSAAAFVDAAAPVDTLPADSTPAEPAATTVAPTTTAPPSPEVPVETLRALKLRWIELVSEQYATPLALTVPCPTITGEQLAAAVAATELTPTARPHAAWLFRDAVGAGIVGIGCGVDLTKNADPPGSTDAVVEVALLDGQAELPAYVTRVHGRDTVIETSVFGGSEMVRCRTGPTQCIATWHSNGVVVTVRLDLPRSDANAAAARQVLHAVVPTVVATLAPASPAAP